MHIVVANVCTIKIITKVDGYIHLRMFIYIHLLYKGYLFYTFILHQRPRLQEVLKGDDFPAEGSFTSSESVKSKLL